MMAGGGLLRLPLNIHLDVIEPSQRVPSEFSEKCFIDLTTNLKNQVRFVSLKVLCARKVADSLPTYAKQGLTKLSSVIPKCLCSLVYQEFLKPYKDIKNSSYMKNDSQKFHSEFIREKVALLAEDLEEFDCRILEMSFKLAYCDRELFHLLAKRSPKLKCFKDNRNDGIYEAFRLRKQPLSEYYSLQNMPNLVILEIISYSVRDVDLQVIGNCLPLLQHLLLYAPFDKEMSIGTSIEGLKYLTKLKLLKHLTFEVQLNNRSENIQLVKNCLLLMPKVNTVAWARTLYVEEHFVEHEFPFYKGSVELELEHLVLGANSVIPSNVSLPNVTRITILETMPLLTTSLKQFKKLQHISFGPLHWSRVEQTLWEVGHLLKRLDLSFYSSCDLLQVFQFCPHLEEVNLMEVEFAHHFHPSQLKNLVHNLKIFTLKRYESEHFLEFSDILHFFLTSCPNLEELELDYIILTKYEMDLITKDLEAGSLSMQNLKKISIYAFVDLRALVSYADFACKVCVKYWKNLKYVSFNDSCYDNTYYLPDMEVAFMMQHKINKGANWRY